MEASTIFSAENKLINLEERNCTVKGLPVTCTKFKYCLKYSGLNLPSTLDLEVSWVLDSRKTRNPRMFFKLDETKNIRNSTMRLYRGRQECNHAEVYIADGIRDKLTPLEVEMRYNLRQASTSYSSSTLPRRIRDDPLPILDQNEGTMQKDSINIQKNCGPDNVCIPDLKLEVK